MNKKRNEIKAYEITSSEAFTKMAELSGLTKPDTIIRLSKEQIENLANMCGCLTENALNAISKFRTLTGDIYIAHLKDEKGTSVFAIDIVRPDCYKTTYVMDQEPVYIWDSSVTQGVGVAEKIFHFDSKGRTFTVNEYLALSSFLESRRDIPIPICEICGIDPGVVSTIRLGMQEVLSRKISLGEISVGTGCKIDGEGIKFEDVSKLGGVK